MDQKPCSDPTQFPDKWTCSKCGEQPLSEFYHIKCPTTKLGWRFKCKKCEGERRKAQYAADPAKSKQQVYAWRKANPESIAVHQARKYERHGHEYLKQMKTERQKRREIVLKHYGGDPPKCAICSSSVYETLCIDHKDGKGNEHRAAIKRKSDGFYRWLIENDFPPEFRVLCHGCNNTLGAYGKTSVQIDGERHIVDCAGNLTKSEESIEGHPAYRRIRRACIYHYGGQHPKCACCGKDEYEKLVIDHVKGGGRQHRKEETLPGRLLYRWLIDNGFPDGFRVLCFNCNFAISAHGVCPHEAVKSEQ